MIDTHSHLLPWVDHGCPDLETSVLMARTAADSGVETIVCTPHLPDWDEPLVARAAVVIEQVRSALAAAEVEVRLLLGFEVDFSVAVTVGPDQLRRLAVEGFEKDHSFPIVLETPYSGWPVYMEDTVFRLSAAGFVPVLAHPERNDRIQASSALLQGCLNAGAVAQATAGSVSGQFGRAAVKALHRLLEEGLISLIASDAHANPTDGWTVTPMLQSLADRLSAEDVVMLTRTNPGLLLEGKPLEPARVKVQASRRGLSRRSRFS